MSLQKLEVHHVRNIEKAELELSPKLNFLIGQNGSGKTSLLEAVYILGRGRSFRSNQAAQIIRFNQSSLIVSGKAYQEADLPPVNLGVQLSKRKREIHLAGRRLQSSAELIWAFPVSLIQPSSSALLDDAPKYRRQFLDWGAFHMESAFLQNWRFYAKALNQRNALLRSQSNEIETWNHELSRYGTIVALARQAYAEKLKPFFLEAAEFFLGQHDFELKLTPGWDFEKPLADVLKDQFYLDQKHGYTHSGPHKGDFSVLADGKPAKFFLSRGQMKLLVFALLLAQAHLMEESVGNRGCVLIDDLASELDAYNRDKLLDFLAKRKAQFFITATDDQMLQNRMPDDSARFHLERGFIKQA